MKKRSSSAVDPIPFIIPIAVVCTKAARAVKTHLLGDYLHGSVLGSALALSLVEQLFSQS